MQLVISHDREWKVGQGYTVWPKFSCSWDINERGSLSSITTMHYDITEIDVPVLPFIREPGQIFFSFLCRIVLICKWMCDIFNEKSHKSIHKQLYTLQFLFDNLANDAVNVTTNLINKDFKRIRVEVTFQHAFWWDIK